MKIPRPPMSLLYGDVTFQTFKDVEDADVYPQILHGTWAELYVELLAENDKGAGIYHTVNGTDAQGRSAANIVEIRAWYTDIDGIKDPRMKRHMAAKLMGHPAHPSLLVETRNGLHAYWYAVPGAPLDLPAYRATEEGIIGFWGGDQSVKDIARVLRTPGFRHRKRKAGAPEPELHVATVLFEAPDMLYTEDELRGHFPPPVRHHRVDFDRSKISDSSGDWGQVVGALFAWRPVEYARHRVMTLACGVGLKFGVSEAQVVGDLLPVVTGWDTGRDMATELKRTAHWAFQRGEPATVTALRREGVDVPRLSKPED